MARLRSASNIGRGIHLIGECSGLKLKGGRLNVRQTFDSGNAKQRCAISRRPTGSALILVGPARFAEVELSIA